MKKIPKRAILPFLFFCLSANVHLNAQSMNNEQLGKIFNLLADTILVEEDGMWQFLVIETPMMCITDEYNNRMRIVAPIKKVEEMEEGELTKCLEANFHTALDVKYAISEGIIWSVFIHPLKELSNNQAVDAITQVRAAAQTYGKDYSSTNLVFPKTEKKERKTWKN